ncbi:MAG TPA: DUF885 domain-containing protein [Longimicrobiaceae bacterium]|nr:DUF885 domain-containing protein [Longimicrobiaceae bacterium]
MTRPIRWTILPLLLGACAPRTPPAAPTEVMAAASAPREETASRVRALADEYVREHFVRNPTAATTAGWPEAEHGRLPDNSLEALRGWQEREDAWLTRVRAIDPTPLTGTPDYLTYAFLREALESRVGLRACRGELWAVSPTYTGWQAGFAFLSSVQPVGTPELRQKALQRFGALPAFLDTEVANLREGLRLGYTAPKSGVRSVIEQMDALLATPTADLPFYSPARRDSTPEFAKALERVAEAEIRPAIRRYRDFLANEYLPAARTDIAVAANPGGDACYRAAVRFHTSLDVPAREIHQTGLGEMSKIQAEMKEIAQRSFGTGDVPALLERLKSDPQYTFRSRQEMIDYAQAAVDRAKAAVPQWFGIVPKAPVVIQPYPPFQEKSAPGGQYSGAPDDGSRPAIYLINTYQPEKQSRAGLESTAFHETYPGHHLQIAIAKERTEAHPITRYFGTSGFSEGWGLYSERLADEMGLFSSDLDRMGLLSNEALRAARLVVDAGMHQLGWSRQQAIDYLLAHTAESPARAAAEVDRYIAVPGQATAYMLGNLEIRRLREMAERAQGEAFDIRSFHDRVLEEGAVTLPVLREKIERWVAEEK